MTGKPILGTKFEGEPLGSFQDIEGFNSSPV